MNENSMPAQAKSKFTAHTLAMTDRKKLSLTGIDRVISSDADEIMVCSCMGELAVTGAELKIDKFDMTTGELVMTGSVESIKYVKAKPPLIKRIFK